MFERFTSDAREAVAGAQSQAWSLGDARVEPRHLLLALADAPTSTADALRRHGADPSSLTRELTSGTEADSGPEPDALSDEPTLSPDDERALQALGIDVNRIRASIEAAFGPGALDRRHRDPGEPARSRWSSRLPFTPATKKALELTLREAVRLKDRELRSEHLVLGVLRGGDRDVQDALTRLGLDQSALRADLEAQLRRSA